MRPGLMPTRFVGARIVGECRRALRPPRRDCAPALRRARSVARSAARQKFARPRTPARIVQQPARRERRQHEIVVDHAVVVDRASRPCPRPSRALRSTANSPMSSSCATSPFGARRSSTEAMRALHGRRLEHGRQQQGRDQRVAAEVGIEAPRAGEKFFLVAQESQRVAGARVVAGARRDQAMSAA